MIFGNRRYNAHELDIAHSLQLEEERINAIIAEMRANPDTDKRLIAIGATDIEKAFLVLQKAVGRPEEN